MGSSFRNSFELRHEAEAAKQQVAEGHGHLKLECETFKSQSDALRRQLAQLEISARSSNEQHEQLIQEQAQHKAYAGELQQKNKTFEAALQAAEAKVATSRAMLSKEELKVT